MHANWDIWVGCCIYRYINNKVYNMIYLCTYTGRFVPGCYALAVSGLLSEEMQVQFSCSWSLRFNYSHVVFILIISILPFRGYVNTTMFNMCLQGELKSKSTRWLESLVMESKSNEELCLIFAGQYLHLEI